MWVTPELVKDQEKGGKQVGHSRAGEKQEKCGKLVVHF
jgi:hypothetical protein